MDSLVFLCLKLYTYSSLLTLFRLELSTKKVQVESGLENTS